MCDFDLFINPSNYDLSCLDFLSFDNLYYCSYVHYFVIEHINGEIESFFGVEFEDLNNYIYGPYLIYAFNHLDNILVEVKKL